MTNMVAMSVALVLLLSAAGIALGQSDVTLLLSVNCLLVPGESYCGIPLGQHRSAFNPLGPAMRQQIGRDETNWPYQWEPHGSISFWPDQAFLAGFCKTNQRTFLAGFTLVNSNNYDHGRLNFRVRSIRLPEQVRIGASIKAFQEVYGNAVAKLPSFLLNSLEGHVFSPGVVATALKNNSSGQVGSIAVYNTKICESDAARN